MESSDQRGNINTHPWRILAALISGLILIIVVVGVIAIFENEQVKDVTERAIRYDLEVEDEGDDLRVAVLDVRHYHRDIRFNGPSPETMSEFELAYADLLEELGELEEIQIRETNVPRTADIRSLAEQYYADFRPAIDLYESDPDAFYEASDVGLQRIEQLDSEADVIDDLGEELANASLTRVDQAVARERIILVSLVGAVILMSVVLAIAAGRIFARLQASFAREQLAVQELARALRLKTDFLADASHQLRTPLTIIRGNAEIGLTTADPGVREEALGEIEAEATRMNELVADLLFLAQSDAGQPPLDTELVPARWLLNRLAKPAEILTQQRFSGLAVNLAGDGYLDVDPARIEQAVLILVDNAAKHTPPGTNVSLTSSVAGGDLIIEVTDEGHGIPPEEMPLIFERFYQIRNRRLRRGTGTGLGLAIAKTIVDAHGGTIEAASRVGAGTRMTIRLPLSTIPELMPATDSTLATA